MGRVTGAARHKGANHDSSTDSNRPRRRLRVAVHASREAPGGGAGLALGRRRGRWRIQKGRCVVRKRCSQIESNACPTWRRLRRFAFLGDNPSSDLARSTAFLAGVGADPPCGGVGRGWERQWRRGRCFRADRLASAAARRAGRGGPLARRNGLAQQSAPGDAARSSGDGAGAGACGISAARRCQPSGCRNRITIRCSRGGWWWSGWGIAPRASFDRALCFSLDTGDQA